MRLADSQFQEGIERPAVAVPLRREPQFAAVEIVAGMEQVVELTVVPEGAMLAVPELVAESAIIKPSVRLWKR